MKSAKKLALVPTAARNNVHLTDIERRLLMCVVQAPYVDTEHVDDYLAMRQDGLVQIGAPRTYAVSRIEVTKAGRELAKTLTAEHEPKRGRNG